MFKTKQLLLACLLCATSAQAQILRPASSTDYLQTIASPGTYVPFTISAEGQKLPVRWGMDTAWANESNMRRGINHIGAENLSMVRACFRTDAPLTGDTAMTNSQISFLSRRIRFANILSPNCDIILNSDQEAGISDYYCTNNKANIDHWVATIAATTKYIQEHYPNHKVIALSPFNEPDYTPWNQGSRSDLKEISRRLKEMFPDIAITAGNTLNCDQAALWYNSTKPYVDWGNTHQLAGSFDTYANFFKLVKDDGKYGYADELHNVGEAIVGVEYGMEAGVWWGFESRARGEFCAISNHGSRIGYGENRNSWTSAAVYRNDETQAVRAFIGSSERQATNATYTFVSNDRDVYFDTEGPLRTYTMQVPGGKGYQDGQTNAERVINVDFGADVPPSPIVSGTFKIMNYATKGVVAVNGTSGGNPNISQMTYSGLDAQKWNFERVPITTAGDYSFYKITNVMNNKYMNVLNNSTSRANIISYDAGLADNEQWYLEYAGNGCYFIRNCLSALYLEMQSNSTNVGVNVQQNFKATTDEGRLLQMWRILPLESECELDAPAVPTGLSAQPQIGGVLLTWTANTEDDLDGYMVLRARKGTNEWNTIARKVKGTAYLDNALQKGVEYEYQLKAIDRSENQSERTASVTAATAAEKGLLARWEFEDDFADATDNLLDGLAGKAGMTFVTEHASGEKALRLDGSTQYVQLPTDIAATDEMTISGWLYWTSSVNATQQFLNFGNPGGQYFFLTPNASRYPALVVNDGTGEQSVASTTRVSLRKWTHMAATISSDRVVLYINGEEVASSSEIGFKPSDLLTAMSYLGRGQSTSASKLQGYVDDVRLYNYALTADEVKAVMDDVASGIELPEEVAAESDASVTYDLQGRRIVTPSPNGVVINRQPDGTYRKVIVTK